MRNSQTINSSSERPAIHPQQIMRQDIPIKVNIPDIKIGDEVYIKSDASKSKARDPFVIIKIDQENKEATVQKLKT